MILLPRHLLRFCYFGITLVCLAVKPTQATAIFDKNQTAQSSVDQNDEKKVSLERAKELYSKYPKEDPWEKIKDASALSWGESYTMQALVDLYEATNNIEYLQDVAFRGDRLLTHRDDRRGVVDGSGKSRPGWSMGLKYVVAENKLLDAKGKPVIELRSTPSSNNNLTKIAVIPAEKSGASTRFTLKVSNEFHKRNEIFSNLSLEPSDDRYIEKIVNDPLSPYSTKPGEYTEKSNLIRIVKVHKGAEPVAQVINLNPITLAFMGYLGVIYDPMMRFAEIVRKDPTLKEFLPAANRFIQAAEESYKDASTRLWRNGPGKDEGYYLTAEKGESFPADNVGQPFNYLAKHVCVELALYRLTGKSDYLERSRRMVTLFKNRIKYNAENDTYSWNYWFEPMTTVGWVPSDNISYNVKVFSPAARVEDVSHAALNANMMAAAYRMGIGFDKTDMQRFANTLLKNVLNEDRTANRRTVDGKGEYPRYFAAVNNWLTLAEGDPQVYHALKEAYLKWDNQTFPFCANLLKWERKITSTK